MKRRDRYFLIGAILTIAFFCSIYFFLIKPHMIPARLALELMPSEYQRELRRADPCLEVRLDNDHMQTVMKTIRHKKAMVMADVALEIELAKDGKVPIEKLAKILKKHDDTETGLYKKIYKDIR